MQIFIFPSMCIVLVNTGLGGIFHLLPGLETISIFHWEAQGEMNGWSLEIFLLHFYLVVYGMERPTIMLPGVYGIPLC